MYSQIKNNLFWDVDWQKVLSGSFTLLHETQSCDIYSWYRIQTRLTNDKKLIERLGFTKGTRRFGQKFSYAVGMVCYKLEYVISIFQKVLSFGWSHTSRCITVYEWYFFYFILLKDLLEIKVSIVSHLFWHVLTKQTVFTSLRDAATIFKHLCHETRTCNIALIIDECSLLLHDWSLLQRMLLYNDIKTNLSR